MKYYMVDAFTSWSGLKKDLEQNALCESLRGRVSYFLTHYHGAPDNYGRFCIRVDGKEYVPATPYNEGFLYKMEVKLREEQEVSAREWDGKTFLHDEVNRRIEKEASRLAIEAGELEIYHVMDALRIYSQKKIQDSLKDENPLVRLFAILDRRVGKRTLQKLKEEIYDQPEWLKFFYQLRLEAEGINK